MADALRENGLGFLYKKCKVIRQGSISKIQYVPEYIEALKAAAESNVVFDDREVFEIIQEVWTSGLMNQAHNKNARQVLQNISRDLYGDPHAWQYK